MAKASILLEKLADHMTDPDNEILLAAEHDQDQLNIISFSLAKCAEVLRETAKDLLKLEPHIDSEALDELAQVAAEFDNDADLSKYADSVDNILEHLGRVNDDLSVDLENAAQLANALDSSGDDKLGKMASVLDEILLTIGAPKGENYNFKAAEDSEIEKLRIKYRTNADKFYGVGKERTDKIADESNKVIKEKVKQYKPNEHALSTRYCPEHNGQSLIRVGDGVSQCPLDKKLYNYESGFTLEDGSIVPPGSVSEQSQQMSNNSEQKLNFSTREDILNV